MSDFLFRVLGVRWWFRLSWFINRIGAIECWWLNGHRYAISCERWGEFGCFTGYDFCTRCSHKRPYYVPKSTAARGDL